MLDIYLYCIDIPGNVEEMVMPCADGYTVYIDIKLSYEQRLDALSHALDHILNDDWNSGKTADYIEGVRHEIA